MTDPDAPPMGLDRSPARQTGAGHSPLEALVEKPGPVTPEGKARVSRNAIKPNSVRRQIAGMMAELKAVMRELKALEAERRPR